MKTFARFVVFFAASILVPGVARPSNDSRSDNMQLAQASEEPRPQPVQPPSPAPTNLPPAPSAEVPAPPSDEPGASDQQVSPMGQWVYTDQYGWVWMPYGDAYSYVPPNGAVPDMYVYYPDVGWCWVVAPWLWGLGPMPFFGMYGTGYFGWYGHGFGHWHRFAYSYVGWGGRGYWHGGQWHGYHLVSPGHPASPHRGSHSASPGSGSRAASVGHGSAMSRGGGSGGHGGQGR